jgi:hypothetical protein
MDEGVSGRQRRPLPEVNSMIKKYLRPEKITVIKAGDVPVAPPKN